jgi:hypothetical protein
MLLLQKEEGKFFLIVLTVVHIVSPLGINCAKPCALEFSSPLNVSQPD